MNNEYVIVDHECNCEIGNLTFRQVVAEYQTASDEDLLAILSLEFGDSYIGTGNVVVTRTGR